MTTPGSDAPSGCSSCPDRRSVLRGAAVGAAAGVAGLLIAPAAPAAAAGRWRVLCATDEVPLGDGIFVRVSSGFTVVVT
ncbi:MAG: hypothetical protein M3353_03670, partial [Actinomycetota bacterium]|nr:hypothetical protein [Actinomycetota bacterium]